MKRLVLVLFVCVFLPKAEALQTYHHPVETIVFIRHAEKPKAGLGQLNCKGLQRSLLLPQYFAKHFPHPDDIFAPKPSVKVYEKHGDKQYYNYIRPLATIEPTAILNQLPVDVSVGYNQHSLLVKKLLSHKYHHATVYVAWEHAYLVDIVQDILNHFNSHAHVPSWSNNNYDRVFVVKIDWRKHTPAMSFSIKKESIILPVKSCNHLQFHFS